jgi:hypothetical protein
MDMGLFCDFLNDHKLGHIFSVYFGVDGKGTSSHVLQIPFLQNYQIS